MSMDQTTVPEAPLATAEASIAPLADPQEMAGEGGGLTGPRRFPAVNPDTIRQAFESGRYPYARPMGRAL
jgi:hypothetical protein